MGRAQERMGHETETLHSSRVFPSRAPLFLTARLLLGACYAGLRRSVSVRFRSKQRGTRVKDSVSFLAQPKPKIPFVCPSLL